MKYGNIFWGVILITLGALFAMRNFDIFFFSWGSIFKLWPLIFVFWGIALLPVKGMLKIVLTVATVAIGIIILSQSPHSQNHWGIWWHDRDNWEQDYDYYSDDDDDYDDSETYDGNWDDQYISDEYDFEDKYARLNLDAVAGEFDIKGVTSYLFEFEAGGNGGRYNATTDRLNDSTVKIQFTQESIRKRKNYRNYFELNLNQNPIWQLNLDVGAADMEMDLTPFKVAKVDIDGGACALQLKLGDKYKKTYVNIDAGASGIEIEVPATSACEVTTSTILSGRELDGFNKISKGLYQTPNFSNSAHQIFIDINAAVSGVKVERY